MEKRDLENVLNRIDKRFDRIEAWMMKQADSNGGLLVYKALTWSLVIAVLTGAVKLIAFGG